MPIARKNPDALPVDVRIEHAEADDELKMWVTWGGTAFDPLAEGDDLSVSIIRKVTASAAHAFDGTNIVTLTF